LIIEVLKVVLFGIVEGITEWLPVSSTGHMILLNELVSLNVNQDFWNLFEVVIQLGAIMAVVILFWNQLWPFSLNEKFGIKQDTFIMWIKIAIACVPAVLVKLKFGDMIQEQFYNDWTIALALIVFGIGFIIIENRNQKITPKVKGIPQITYKAAFVIGLFQSIAVIFPGTSRSGATILGAILIGFSRSLAVEFSFFLAIPAMVGGSLLEILDFGLKFTGTELFFLCVGMITAFVTSMLVIRILIGYIKTHTFKIFGWYRIILGIIVLINIWL
jgi:undecaprenyl-diphosphatase